MRLDFGDAAEKTPAKTPARRKTAAPPPSAPIAEPELPLFAKEDAPAKKSDEPAIISVSDVNRAVKSSLESEFRQLWVKGEISNFKPHSSGHFYFCLKDAKASINAVMFRGFNQGLRFKPHDGLEVIVRGKLTVYEPRGNYQLFCEMMEPVGAGALQIAFDQLKRKLELEGLFHPSRKRALPALPRHVAVVTSPTGAAIRDILNVLGRRFKGLRVTVVSAVVQGPAAPDSICAGIAAAHKLGDVDVMIVGRGGGSIEDLWGFNEEKVARAIAASTIPTISAVGHEIDFTIADFVADLRAPTPSAAAELVCKNAGDLTDRIGVHKKRLWNALLAKFRYDRQQLNAAARRLVDPKRRLLDLSMRNDELTQRLEGAIRRNLQRERQQVRLYESRLPSPRQILLRLQQTVRIAQTKLEGQWARRLDAKRAQLGNASLVLDAVSPLKVLDRGYSLTRKDGVVVRGAGELKSGDLVQIKFGQGEAEARIEKTKES